MHSKPVSKPSAKNVVPLPVEPARVYHKLKINRLKLDEQYRLVQPIPNRHGVIVKNQGKYFKVFIPRDMKILNEGGAYLVRPRGSKRTVWKM